MMTDRELNALVAERVMGLRVDPDDCGCTDCILGETLNSLTLPDYCNDIAAAWSVVDKMESLYYECEVYQGSAFCERQAKFWKSDNQGDSLSYATSESLPRAICLAALKAVGVDISHVG